MKISHKSVHNICDWAPSSSAYASVVAVKIYLNVKIGLTFVGRQTSLYTL